MVEGRSGEIAGIKDGSGQIALGKVDVVQLKVLKGPVSELRFEKRRLAEVAVVKVGGKPELVAVVEAQAEHLAVPELAVAEDGAHEFRHADVAPVKFALDENPIAQISRRKVAIDKYARFILVLFERIFGEIDFVERFIFHCFLQYPSFSTSKRRICMVQSQRHYSPKLSIRLVDIEGVTEDGASRGELLFALTNDAPAAGRGRPPPQNASTLKILQ